jgi:hypothetical protein
LVYHAGTPIEEEHEEHSYAYRSDNIGQKLGGLEITRLLDPPMMEEGGDEQSQDERNGQIGSQDDKRITDGLKKIGIRGKEAAIITETDKSFSTYSVPIKKTQPEGIKNWIQVKNNEKQKEGQDKHVAHIVNPLHLKGPKALRSLIHVD